MVIEFPQLKELYLKELSNFTSLFPTVVTTASKNLQPFFNDKVALPSLEVLRLDFMEVLGVMAQDDQLPAGSLCKLREITVYRCNNVRSIFPSRLLPRLQNLEVLELWRCVSLKVVFAFNIEDGDVKHFQLKRLTLNWLPELMHVWKGNPRGGDLYFQSLSFVHVEDCKRLRYLFSPIMAKSSTLQLQEIIIQRCEMMSGIVEEQIGEAENAGDIVIEFPQLKDLYLKVLPNLTSFFPTVVTTASKNLQPLFTDKVTFPNLEELQLEKVNNKEIFYSQIPSVSFCKLRVLKVESCHNLVNLVPWHMLKIFSNLEELEVKGCDSLEEVFDFQDINIKGRHPLATPLQNLISIKISNCGRLRSLFSTPTAARGLVRLQILTIVNCAMMEEIIANEEPEEQQEMGRMDKIIFPELQTLEFQKLSRLRDFCHVNNCALELPLLKEVVVGDCPEMNIFSLGFLSTPKLNCVRIGERNWTGELPAEMIWMGDLNTTIKHLYEQRGKELSNSDEEEDDDDEEEEEDDEEDLGDFKDEDEDEGQSTF